MASLTVNPTNYNISDINTNSVRISFSTDVVLKDVKLSTDNGQSFLNNISMSQTRADFDISHLTNNNYTCLLKGFYEEAQDGNGGNDTGSNVINALNYMTYGKGINQTTAEITDNPECWATVNPITVERGATYKISLNATHAWVFSFDDNDRFRTHLVLGNNTNPQEYTFTADTSKIRLGCYDPNKQLTYCTLTKVVSEELPNTSYNITRNLTNCSSSNLANTITQGSAYTSTITANDGYNIGDLTVTMGGVDITSSVVSDNTSPSSDFTITYDLSNCSSSNKATSISSGEIYDTTISPKI